MNEAVSGSDKEFRDIYFLYFFLRKLKFFFTCRFYSRDQSLDPPVNFTII